MQCFRREYKLDHLISQHNYDLNLFFFPSVNFLNTDTIKVIYSFYFKSVDAGDLKQPNYINFTSEAVIHILLRITPNQNCSEHLCGQSKVLKM